MTIKVDLVPVHQAMDGASSGWILIAIGLIEWVLMATLILPRISPGKRSIVLLAISVSSALFIIIGALFLFNVIHL